MEFSELKALIDSLETYVAVRVIERNIGMPKTTLQKALKYPDKSKLPKKWVKPLLRFVEKQNGFAVLVKEKPDNKKDKASVGKSEMPDPSNKGEYLKWLKNNS